MSRQRCVLADAADAAASREIQASQLRPSSRSLGTTFDRLTKWPADARSASDERQCDANRASVLNPVLCARLVRSPRGCSRSRAEGDRPLWAVLPGRQLRAWVPDDLPEVSVEVAEIPRVDPPRPVMRRPGERGAGGLGLREQSVNVLLARNEMSDAELA